jgi:hypothetical protein
MAVQTIPAILRIRRGSFTQWNTANPVLMEGEAGVVSPGQDQGKFKVGDGTTPWNDLPYIIGTDGTAATVSVSATQTVSPETPASVVNEGSENAAKLRFLIPRGYPGTTIPDITGLTMVSDYDDGDLSYIFKTGEQAMRKITFGDIARAQFNLEHPVGSTFTQEPWDLSPADRNWPGNWVNWSFRAWEYCLSQTAPSSGFIADWKQKRHDIWNLNTDGTVATQGTKKYAIPSDYVRVVRQVIHNGIWDDGDLEEGGQVQGGAYDGWYVWQVLAPAGIFPSVEDDGYTGGGFRPPFISGGVAPDHIRDIVGTDPNDGGSKGSSGPFRVTSTSNTRPTGMYTGVGRSEFIASYAVPTGPQNSPVTASVRIWRRLP